MKKDIGDMVAAGIQFREAIIKDISDTLKRSIAIKLFLRSRKKVFGKNLGKVNRMLKVEIFFY